MAEQWCHLNGTHGPHEWKSGLGVVHSCTGSPAPEDYEDIDTCAECGRNFRGHDEDHMFVTLAGLQARPRS